jgi:hypothetical protein
MNASNKIQWMVRLTAGVAVMALTTGCHHEQAGIVHGEQFQNEHAERALYEFNDRQAANAARLDGTLRDYHFDAARLNSLGESRLELMLYRRESTGALVVYLDLLADDTNTPKRQSVVLAYLKDRGFSDDQIEFRSGPNPNWNSPVAPLLAAQAAAAGGSATGGAAPAGAAPTSGTGSMYAK